MTDTRLRAWLTGLLAGLFALAVLAVPGEHARMMLDRAGFALAYAMPDGTLPVLCTGTDSHDDGLPGSRHGVAPDCLACVLLAAPGLPPSAPPLALRIAAPALADRVADRAPVPIRVAFARRHARAPPFLSIL